MKFVPDGSKLKITAESENEAIWLRTLKQSSLRVKKGSERFVIRAFQQWNSSTTGAEKERIKNAPSKAEEARREQEIAQTIAQADSRLQGELIAEATRQWQRIFRETPQWSVYGDPAGYCEVELHGANCHYEYKGSGRFLKEAKADAAKCFLDRNGL
jgi:hypothetical protein